MSIKFVTEAKKATHFIAAGGALVLGKTLDWAMSDHGREVIGAVVKAYPKASIITGILGFLGTLYYKS